MKRNAHTLALFLVLAGLATGCVPVVRTSIVHYGVAGRLVDADTGEPLARQQVQVVVDFREHTEKTNKRGEFQVPPKRLRYWAWLMGGPFYPNPFRASIEIRSASHDPYTRESIVVPESLDSPAPDKSRLADGCINLGDVAMKKRQPDGAANGSQPIRSETNRRSSAAGSGG